MLVKKNIILSAAVLMALAACGSDHYTPTSNSGKAVDGYLQGSTVLCVPDKTTTTTSAAGVFTFTPACAGPYQVTGGTNADTGFAFKGNLTGLAGSTIVSPLTTLLGGLSSAQVATLLTSLGLPANTDLNNTDPADGQHFALFKATVAVQQIVQQLANTFGGLLASTDITGLYAKIAASVATSLLAPGAPLFAADGSVNLTLLKAIGTGAAATTGAAAKISVADLAAVADQIAVQSTAILQAATVGDLVSQAKVVQDPTAPPVDTSGGTKFLALQGDAVLVNGTMPVTLAQFATGVTVNKLSTIGFDIDVSRAPVMNNPVSIFLELVEQSGGSGRKLQVMIDKVQFTLTAGQLSIVPATDAKVFVYGHTRGGTDLNLTLTDLSFHPLGVVNNKLTLDFDAIVKKVLLSADNTSKIVAASFVDITGSFNAKVVFSNLNIRHETDGSSLDVFPVSVTGSSTPTSIAGRGLVGKLTTTQ
ncbi:hypothetical protein AAKU55_000803 [Oxalobacteraceae bacterium GrIS 1.11]